MSLLPCPLCKSPAALFIERRARDYYKCPNCSLVFLDPQKRPSPEAEKRRYEFHNNDPQEPGYRRFLMGIAKPCMEAIRKESLSLDYGCGPAKSMAAIFAESGYRMESYDPCFFPQSPRGPYDLIVCCEVFEHFFNPAKELARLSGLLKTDGILAVRTELWSEETNWSAWHYLTDSTHVVFYHRRTFEYIRRVFAFKKAEFSSPSIVLLNQ